jgi:outer membrane lipoprotein-sorting protein
MKRCFDICKRGLYGAAWLSAALASSMAWTQEAFTLEQLMHTLAATSSGEATFIERRTVLMLDRTLESTGRLSFQAPDTLVRETLKPRQERVQVTGNTVTISQGARTRTLALDSLPEAAVILEAIRGTLSHNRSLLQRHFSAKVSGQAEQWVLELTPRDALLREQVLSVRLSGLNAQVREVQVVLADGDRSVMSIEPLASAAVPR